MVGDYGWVFNMTNPKLNFDALDAYVGNITANGGHIDFLMSMGDNMYLTNEYHPPEKEVDEVMQLFNRKNIKDLNIWAIRGNHDCTSEDQYFQVNLTKKYPTWRMPDLYYSKLFDIGSGKKFAAVFVDSCLALCANFSYSRGSGGDDLLLASNARHDHLSPEVRNLKFGVVNCSDPFMMKKGADMMNYINDTFRSWQTNKDIVWRATV